ncbi:MAG: GerMN domain-containing protein [Clostridia bacterium]|nr:GerMN domain-containing protein [Clostridia bacterium]
MWKYIRRSALLLLCGCMLLSAGCGGEEPTDPQESDPVSAEAGYRRTILYYRSDEGFIVPVMKLLPWEEGIGKAALSHLIGTEENQREASAKGLNTLLPAGVELTLRIGDDKTATLNIIGLPEYPDAASEAAMVTGVAQTLLEFASIDRVQFLFDGEAQDALPQGTPVAEPRTSADLNLDPGDVAASVGSTYSGMTLYFPNLSGSLYVPVTRYIEGTATLESALTELLRGPLQEGLLACLPEGTRLLSCTVEDGTVTVDFSDEIERAGDVPGMTEAMCDSIALTAACYGEVSQLHILSNGELFAVGDLSASHCANEWNA